MGKQLYLLNKQFYKNIQKITISLSFCMLIVKTNSAQQLIMSSMGQLEHTTSISAAINFKSNTNCIDVQSGIMVLNSYKSFGEFVVNCEVKQQFNALGIKLFPNPVKSMSKIKFINTPPQTEIFNISIWNADGTFIKSLSSSGYTIFQGMLIDLSNIAPGGYVLKIESPQYLEALKFIKAD